MLRLLLTLETVSRFFQNFSGFFSEALVILRHLQCIAVSQEAKWNNHYHWKLKRSTVRMMKSLILCFCLGKQKRYGMVIIRESMFLKCLSLFHQIKRNRQVCMCVYICLCSYFVLTREHGTMNTQICTFILWINTLIFEIILIVRLAVIFWFTFSINKIFKSFWKWLSAMRIYQQVLMWLTA